MFLFFTVASHVTASKNSDHQAMLNAIQHGVTIANLQISRKEQQCGLCNIGDWGEGLTHVLSSCSCPALAAKVSDCFWALLFFSSPAKHILMGKNGQDPLLN